MSTNRPPLVSIILVNYNGAAVVLNCLRSLQQFNHSVTTEIIVVDNASADGSPDQIAREFPQINLIRLSQNVGFGTGNNIGARQARGEFLLLLNTDTLLIEDVLPELLRLMQAHPEAGMIGPRLLNADRTLQLSIAQAIGIKGEFQTLRQLQKARHSRHQEAVFAQYQSLQAVDIVVGAAFLIRKTLFQQLGGFDQNFFMYFEESDLCQRTRDTGWQVLYTPTVSLIHLGGYSVGQRSQQMALEYRRSQLYYYQKHRPLWEQLALRIYLLIKFVLLWVKARDRLALEVLPLLVNFQHYPLKFRRGGFTTAIE